MLFVRLRGAVLSRFACGEFSCVEANWLAMVDGCGWVLVRSCRAS